jgi:hypothetical protein
VAGCRNRKSEPRTFLPRRATNTGNPEVIMRKFVPCALGPAIILSALNTATADEDIFSRYTQFNANKECPHKKGVEEEDYGSWRCPGYEGIGVFLAAGDQRMYVSFGRNQKEAHDQIAAGETLRGFNEVYKGTVEWRIERLPNGKTRPFATILRWNYVRDVDDRNASGRMLVVTRLNPGGVCHVGYVDKRSPDANVEARKVADEKARTFKCGVDSAKNPSPDQPDEAPPNK